MAEECQVASQPDIVEASYDDGLLTKAFEDQIKLIRNSIIARNTQADAIKSTAEEETIVSKKTKRSKKKKQITPNAETTQEEYPMKKAENIITHKSTLYRLEDSVDLQSKPIVGSTSLPAGDNVDLDKKKPSFSKPGHFILKETGPIMPPPFPQLNNLHIKDEDEAHTSMLMSWYMAGYHTGYYAAMKKYKL